jgi:hypothetical protein
MWSIIAFGIRCIGIGLWIKQFLRYERQHQEPHATIILLLTMFYCIWAFIWLFKGTGII